MRAEWRAGSQSSLSDYSVSSLPFPSKDWRFRGFWPFSGRGWPVRAHEKTVKSDGFDRILTARIGSASAVASMHVVTPQDFQGIAIYSPDALEMLVRNAVFHIHVRRERMTCAAGGPDIRHSLDRPIGWLAGR